MNRVVVFGASGFVGKTLLALFDKSGTEYIAPKSKDIDLTSPDSVNKITKILNDGDLVVFLPVYTPEKGDANVLTLKNIQMIKNTLDGIKSCDIRHFIYVSSDAVYALSSDVIDENTPAVAGTLYGIMHVTREQYARENIKPEKLTILRPCAIYGEGDTHNAYGVMRFIRSAREKAEITLFGGGEEYRDHINVEDFAAIIVDALKNKVSGTYNVATGKSWRFSEIAEIVKNNSGKKVNIIEKPRGMPIAHRHMNTVKLSTAFPACKMRHLDAGIKQILKK